jgi:hypothetical protein
MITLWTVYDRPIKILGQPFACGWTARRSVVAEPGEVLELDDAPEHLKLSSDIQALRDQLQKMGLHCRGRHPADPPEIIEVWLGRRKSDGRQDLSRAGRSGTDSLP